MLISLRDNLVKEMTSFVNINKSEDLAEESKESVFNFLDDNNPYGIFDFEGYNNIDELNFHEILKNNFFIKNIQHLNFIYISVNKIEMRAVIYFIGSIEYLLISNESIELLENKSDIKIITDSIKSKGKQMLKRPADSFHPVCNDCGEELEEEE